MDVYILPLVLAKIIGRDIHLSTSGMVEPHRRHFVVALRKKLYPLLSPGSTQEDPPRHDRKCVDWDVKNQIKLTKHLGWPRSRGNNGPYRCNNLQQLYWAPQEEWRRTPSEMNRRKISGMPRRCRACIIAHGARFRY